MVAVRPEECRPTNSTRQLRGRPEGKGEKAGVGKGGKHTSRLVPSPETVPRRAAKAWFTRLAMGKPRYVSSSFFKTCRWAASRGERPCWASHAFRSAM